MRFFFFLFLVNYSFTLFAQEKRVEISPSVQLSSQNIQLDSFYVSSGREQIAFSKLKFYFSKPQVSDKGYITEVEDAFYLFDVQHDTLSFFLSTVPPFDSLSFLLGIDSLTNDAGVKGGVLDPLNGMYWSWRTGYINVKIEGKYISNEGLMENFIFHLGGFLGEGIGSHRFVCKSNDLDDLSLILHIDFLWKYLKENNKRHIMSPGDLSEQLMQLITENIQCE